MRQMTILELRGESDLCHRHSNVNSNVDILHLNVYLPLDSFQLPPHYLQMDKDKQKESKLRKLFPFVSKGKRPRVAADTGGSLPTAPSQSSQQLVPTGSFYSGAFFPGAKDFNIHGGQFNNNIEAQYVTVLNNPDQMTPNVSTTSDVLVCPSPSPQFVGRKDILVQLSGIFSTSDHADQQRVVTLVASGGTGKTQVALKFVQENRSSSDVTLVENFKKLGRAQGIGEEVENIRNHLERNFENWLCIFDNADDREVLLKNYIPQCSHGNIIITSRLKETAQLEPIPYHIHFGDLDQESAIILLLKHAQKDNSEENKNLASKIVTSLGCHALAVSTAGSYIQATSTCSLSDYLPRFEKQRKKHLNYKMKALDNYQKTVFSAFMLSFEKLTQPTKHLMQICSFLHPASIPTKLFVHAAAFPWDDFLESERDVLGKAEMEKFLSQFEQENSLLDSIDELCQLSLASYHYNEKILSFHSIIHTCTRETLAQENNMSSASVLLLSRATPLGETEEDYSFRKQLLVHASEVQWNNSPTVYARKSIAKIFKDAGYWSQCEILEEEVLLLQKEKLGVDHPDTLSSMYYLSWTYRDRGKLEEAEKLQEEVLLLQKEIIGAHHPHTLDSMNNLALTYWHRGNLEEAEKLEEEVLLLRKEKTGVDHPSTLTSMSNLAVTYWKRGKLEEAERLQKEALLLSKEKIGVYHPRTLISMNNLALVYLDCGKLEEAEKLQDEVLLLRKEKLGVHHPSTLTSMNNLASTYQKQGKLEEAVELQEEVLLLQKVKLRVHHPDTLTSMNNLAVTYWKCGKLEEAEKLQEEALFLCQRVLGHQHPHTLGSMGILVNIYHALGKSEEAEQLKKEITTLLKKEV